MKRCVGATVLLVLGSISMAAGQNSDESAQQLVKETVQNELASGNQHRRFLYKDQKEALHGSQTSQVVETDEGSVSMLVAIDGKPLSLEQRQAEQRRLASLRNDPEELKKKQKTDREDQEREDRIMRALPDAFLFEPDGTEPGQDDLGKVGDDLVRFKFHPNPKYQPPTRVEQVLVGMRGVLVIDTTQKRIAKIDGTLFKEVAFGWSILGHLDKGGHFLVQQADEGNGAWEMTREDLQFTGKVLMVKSLNIKSNEVFSCFHPIPRNLSLAQGVELLEKQSAEVAQR